MLPTWPITENGNVIVVTYFNEIRMNAIGSASLEFSLLVEVNVRFVDMTNVLLLLSFIIQIHR